MDNEIKLSEPEIRVFLPGSGEIEILTGECGVLPSRLDVTSTASSNEQWLVFLRASGGFSIPIENSLEVYKKWGREFYRRAIWVYDKKDRWLFNAVTDPFRIVGKSSEGSLSLEQWLMGNKKMALGVSFHSNGVLTEIPDNLLHYLTTIVAFEQDMPNTLQYYRDWTEEVGWQERCAGLTEEWIKCQKK